MIAARALGAAIRGTLTLHMARVLKLGALGLAVAVAACAWWLLDRTPSEAPAAPAVRDTRPAPREATSETSLAPPPTTTTARSETESVKPEVTVDAVAREPASNEPRWRLSVVDESGRPSSGARVLVIDDDETAWESKTDGSGVVAAEPREGDADVFVAAPDRPLEHARVARLAGTHAIELSRTGTMLAGVATVGGRPPEASLELAFEPRVAVFAERPLSAAVRARLDALSRHTARTDNAGRFLLGGVPLDWSGSVLAPRGHHFRAVDPSAPAPRRLAIDQPSSKLRLEFERVAHLVGRVVEASGHPAPSGARIRAMIHRDGGRSSSGYVEALDDAGRFAFPIGDSMITTVELAIETSAGQLAAVRTGDELERNARGDLDAGILTLLARRPLRCRVLDEVDRPLAKARARITGDADWSETGDDGMAEVSSSAVGSATLRVVARGYWAQSTPVELPTDTIVEVRLSPSTRCELVFVDPARRPVRDVLVRLSSEGEPLFPESSSWLPDDDMIGLVAGAPLGSGEDVGGVPKGWFDVRPDRTGRIEIQGLSPTVIAQLEVFDLRGASVLAPQPFSLGGDMQRSQEFVVTARLAEIHGRVIDIDGQPIARASLRIPSSDTYGDALTTKSDSTGRYSFRGIAGESVTLRVTAEGFAPSKPTVVQLRDEENTFDVVLERR